MILVVDDDKTIRFTLKLVLERNDYTVALAENPKEAITVVRSHPEVELVLMDMNYDNSTTGDEGLTLLKQVKVFRPDLPCILMTAWGTIDLAVQGMRAGAFDFITKPWDNGVLMDRIETARTLSPLPRTRGERGEGPSSPPSPPYIPPSPASRPPMHPSSSRARAVRARSLLPRPFTGRAVVPKDLS